METNSIELEADRGLTPLQELIHREELAEKEVDLKRMRRELFNLSPDDRTLLERRFVGGETLKKISISLIADELAKNDCGRRQATRSVPISRTVLSAGGEIATRVRANVEASAEARTASKFAIHLLREAELTITHKPAENRVRVALRRLRKLMGVVRKKTNENTRKKNGKGGE
jgi:hypothetical protein